MDSNTLVDSIISLRNTNVSFTKYLLKIETDMQIEVMVRLVKQRLGVWWNRGKETDAGEMMNQTLGDLSVWRNKEREKSRRIHESDAHVTTNEIQQASHKSDRGLERYAVFSVYK